MVEIDVKQRISSLQELPVLPHLAREVLTCLDTGLVHWEELAAIADFDDAIVHQFHGATSQDSGVPPESPLVDRLMALGLPRIAQLTFERIAPSLFDPARIHGLDIKTFWSHAYSVASYSDKIAQKIESRYQPQAYVAGLLHDIGKLALDRVAPGGYSRALELVRQQGLFALEAERREMGADHAVAGKWLAEAWGMPSSIVFSTWLHHHPPGTLDSTPYPVELIEIVSLANVLAHGDDLETPAQERLASMDEQRYSRLGLERLDVLELIRGGANGSEPELGVGAPPVEAAKPQEPRTEIAQLRYERNLYSALCTFHERLQPGLAPTAQLSLFVDGLRTAFSISSGICYLTDVRGGIPIALRWQSQDDVPESIPTAGDAESGGALLPLDDLIATLGPSAQGKEPVRRHGFVALPLLDGNRGIGQIIFQGDGGPVLSENFLRDLMRFVKSAGAALAHCKALRSMHDEAESLAAAVWKQELNHRHDRRTERLISVGKMAAGAAHEINNPLAVISGKAQMLLANAANPEDTKALEIIVEHSQRASGILRDLLQFARPNPPQLMPGRISYLVKNSLDRVRKKLEDEGIQLVEEYAQDLPQIPVDRMQMDQVFQNLLQNAEQGMARQGDKLTVRVRPNQDRTAVLVQIVDTGQGIAADIMDKVFEPFFTTQSGSGGTGMGLAVCHGIVEAHRGTITLHSQEGTGTTCTVTLPLSAEKTAPQAAPEKPVAVQRATPSTASSEDSTLQMPPAVGEMKTQRLRPEGMTRPKDAITRRDDPPIGEEVRTARRDDSPALAPEVAAALKTDASGEEPLLPSDRPRERNPRVVRQSRQNPAPRSSESHAAEAKKTSADTPAGGRILLVDDDVELRDVLAEALKNRGYTVRTAADGLEALAEVIANPMDLILLDVGIQGVNTPVALVDEIQKRKPNVSIVMLLGPTSNWDEGVASGPANREVLRKPFNVAQLFQTIETALLKRSVA
jgi:signal transduction histidine kinase/ActR/RegA family two-component response regulator